MRFVPEQMKRRKPSGDAKFVYHKFVRIGTMTEDDPYLKYNLF